MHDALPALPEMPLHNALHELPFQNTRSQNALPHDAPPKDALPQRNCHTNALPADVLHNSAP